MNKTLILLIGFLSFISLTACTSFASLPANKNAETTGNKANMANSNQTTLTENVQNTNDESDTGDFMYSDKSDLKKLRAHVKGSAISQPSSLKSTIPESALSQSFHKVPNPELRMYITPHLAGSDEMPVPGYYTAFNVYEHDHYALAQEE